MMSRTCISLLLVGGEVPQSVVLPPDRLSASGRNRDHRRSCGSLAQFPEWKRCVRLPGLTKLVRTTTISRALRAASCSPESERREPSWKKNMSDETEELSGPDFVAGVELSTVADGVPLLGHAHGEPVILVRRGADLFAVGALCTHYGGPLAEGLVVDETIRCPWHHAAFSLRTGEAVRAPALNPIACRHVTQRDGKVHVGDVIHPEPARSARPAGNGALSTSIVIVGG